MKIYAEMMICICVCFLLPKQIHTVTLEIAQLVENEILGAYHLKVQVRFQIDARI